MKVMSVPPNPIDWISFSNFSYYRNEIVQIGDFAHGGIVFYLAQPNEDLDGDGHPDNGYVVAPGSAIPDTTWGCQDTLLPGNFSTLLGSGKSNTDLLLAHCEESHAAQICHELDLNLYRDWFLPSLEELRTMNRNVGLASPSTIANPANIELGSYWTSSQKEADLAYSTTLAESGGGVGCVSKDDVRRVRAIRVF